MEPGAQNMGKRMVLVDRLQKEAVILKESWKEYLESKNTRTLREV